MTDLQLFDFEGRKVRFVGTADRPEWVADDVCSVFEIQKTGHTFKDFEEGYEKGWCNIPTLKGNQKVLTLFEPGLYRLAFKSRKPQAVRFQRWVFQDVLPAIRRQGFYLFPDATAAQLKNAMQTIERQQERIATLESECKVLKESERQQVKAELTAQIASRINELEALQQKEWVEWDDRTAQGRIVKEFTSYLRELNLAAHEDRISTATAQDWMDKAEQLLEESVTKIKTLPPELPDWQSLYLYISDWKDFRLQSIDNSMIWRQRVVTAN